MPDSVQLTVTKADGTVVNISGTITDAAVAETAPAPTITGVTLASALAVTESGSAQFTASVQGTGAFNPAVTWNASAGSISASGAFTAPAAAGPVTITATSVQDPTKSASITITVNAPPPPPPPSGAPIIPATATVVNMLTDATAWQENHDAGTSGNSSGTTAYPVTAPDGSQNCRRFDMTLTAHGGEIYHKSVMRDASKFSSFCYEAEELSGDWSNVQNEEKDIEQIDAHGNKLDMATQEAGGSNTEEVTGKPLGWTQTSVKNVDPSKRAPNVWHLIRKFFRNNLDGTVTYEGVEIDGVYMPINLTLNDTKASNWSDNDLNFQYQFDGKTSGSAQTTIWVRKLNVYCY